MEDGVARTSETVAWPDGEQWRMAPNARGPFPGQHGGVVCALLAGAMERRAEELGAGLGLQFNAYLLRAGPVGPVSVPTEDIRVGGRTAFLKAEMRHGKKLTGWASAVFVKPQSVDGLDAAPMTPMTPASAHLDMGRDPGEPWFRETVDMRRDGEGMVWLRHKTPTVPEMGPLAFTASLADWTSGFSRPDWADSGVVTTFPNVDLTIHLLRAPRGPWVGIDGRSIWHRDGHGSTFAELYDENGLIGRGAQTVVLVAR